MRLLRDKNKVVIVGLIAIAALTTLIVIAVYLLFCAKNSSSDETMSEVKKPIVDQGMSKADEESTKLIVAKDETLGSGFAVKYPENWMRVHAGATNPESLTTVQTDETTFTSPSGHYKVVLKVQTNGVTTTNCTPDYLQLMYLHADKEGLPNFAKGRFVEYVVYFPSLNLYQYHIGLQKNTAAIRSVTIDNDTDCEFMFSEFIQRKSSNPKTPVTSTFLGIKPVELLDGENLKPGVTEKQIAEKLSGKEYEQAKAIVKSLYTQ